jgi:hypothetical protein
LNGKPLESYRVDPRSLPAFERIKAIFNSEQLPGDLKAAFDFILDRKTWYLLPAPLSTLGSEKIAWAGNTEQGALQDFKQILLDEARWQGMNLDEQSTLLVHELLMGLKLFKFDSAYNECMAFKTAFHNNSLCNNSYSIKERGRPSELTKLDYAQIRLTTTEMIKNGSELLEEDWEDLFAKNGFSAGQRDFVQKDSKKTLSFNEINKMLGSTKVLEAWPIYGFDFAKLLEAHPEFLSAEENFRYDWISDISCEKIEIKVENDQIAFGLDGQLYSATLKSPIELVLRKEGFSNAFYFMTNLPTLISARETGGKVLFVDLGFIGETLAFIGLQEGKCLNDECSSHASTAHSGKKIFCFSQKRLFLQR